MDNMQAAELHRIFRETFRARRLELGLSQAALAERLGVAQPYVAQLEKGKRLPSLDYLTRIAEALQTSPDALLRPGIFSEAVA